MAKKLGYIKGTIGFYGKVDNYAGDGKEYCLRINNPEPVSIDAEAVEEAYPKKGKYKRPAIVQRVLDQEKMEAAYFNSKYPITKVWVKKDGKIEEVAVTNPELKDMEVLMTFTGPYIGSLLLNEVPSEFTPAPFQMEDFDEDELPFN